MTDVRVHLQMHWPSDAFEGFAHATRAHRKQDRGAVVLHDEPELPFDPPELAILIARRAFVAAFYGALRAYALSDDYRPGEWAAVTVGADLRDKGVDVGAADLAAWNAKRLQGFLAKVYRVDYVTFPDAPSERADSTNSFSRSDSTWPRTSRAT